jgi:hypothetical protein
MEKEYIGIDYSLGRSNVDQKTGIHHGVIPQNEVLQAWVNSSEPYYTLFCPVCDTVLQDDFCPQCRKEIDSEDLFDQFEFAKPTSFYVDDKEYQAESDDSGDIFISKSPYYTNCQYCSPCAPGAGYIMNTVKEEGIKTYCFGHSWFEDEKAPYPVYSVETEQLIEP